MDKTDKIFVAGHNGMVGSSIVRALKNKGYKNIIVAPRSQLDLTDATHVKKYFMDQKPDYVFLAAAKVGGIKANKEAPGDFLYINLMIQNNVIHECLHSRVKQIVFLGSSCIYPRECPQPMKEEFLMTGPIEPTNEGYALAKIAGLKLAQFYHEQYGLQSLNPLPCNLYGTNDSFDPNRSHVLSALVKKMVDAVDEKKNEVVLWGSGIARREFMHVEDFAQALIFLTERWQSPDIINIGPGTDISIRDLAELIAEQTGYSGKILWDSSMPDGMLRKCLDVSKLHKLGYKPLITLPEGISRTIEEYRILKRKETIA